MVLASAVAIIVLRILATATPGDDTATTPELLLAAFIILAGLPGIGMLVEGPAIFGPVDRPNRR